MAFVYSQKSNLFDESKPTALFKPQPSKEIIEEPKELPYSGSICYMKNLLLHYKDLYKYAKRQCSDITPIGNTCHNELAVIANEFKEVRYKFKLAQRKIFEKWGKIPKQLSHLCQLQASNE